MSRQHTLSANYRLIKCHVGRTTVPIGLVGSLQLGRKSAIVFSCSRSTPPRVKGLDDVGQAMLSALPEALHRDINELLRSRSTLDDVFTELGRRYRGSVFLDPGQRANFKLKLNWPMMPTQIVENIEVLFRKQVLTATQRRASRRAPDPRNVLRDVPAIEARPVTLSASVQ